jgi:NhaA family Na+:H+ antiporter
MDLRRDYQRDGFVVLESFVDSAACDALIAINSSSPAADRIFVGTIVGLVVGKPLGVLLWSGIAMSMRVATAPEGVTLRQFVGAACLCGVGDTMSLLMADRAFGPADAAVAKLAVLAGSVNAGTVGSLVLRSRAVAATARAGLPRE